MGPARLTFTAARFVAHVSMGGPTNSLVLRRKTPPHRLGSGSRIARSCTAASASPSGVAGPLLYRHPCRCGLFDHPIRRGDGDGNATQGRLCNEIAERHMDLHPFREATLKSASYQVEVRTRDGMLGQVQHSALAMVQRKLFRVEVR
jgi:hypothetical protein